MLFTTVLCRFWILKRVAQAWLLSRFDVGSLKCCTFTVKSWHFFTRSGLLLSCKKFRVFWGLFWHFFLALDTVKLTTHPESWLHLSRLSFCGQFSGSCAWPSSTSQNTCLFTYGNKHSVCINDIYNPTAQISPNQGLVLRKSFPVGPGLPCLPQGDPVPMACSPVPRDWDCSGTFPQAPPLPNVPIWDSSDPGA